VGKPDIKLGRGSVRGGSVGRGSARAGVSRVILPCDITPYKIVGSDDARLNPRRTPGVESLGEAASPGSDGASPYQSLALPPEPPGES
jgi:hypothetical protein